LSLVHYVSVHWSSYISNLDTFQIARSVMLLYSLLALAIPYTYFYIRGVLEKRKYALTMAVEKSFLYLPLSMTCCWLLEN